MCQISVVIYLIPYSSPLFFNIPLSLSRFIIPLAPCLLKHSNLCFAFYCISHFVAFYSFSAIVSIVMTIFCVVIRALILSSKYLVNGFLPAFNGTSKTKLQQVVEFGSWQDTCSKSPILINYFLWGCLVWNVTFASKCLQLFQNVRHGQKKWWPCLV